MLVTSASVLSDVHLGGCAVPFPILTSEKGIFEGVLKAGINLEPMSFFKCREETELKRKSPRTCSKIKALLNLFEKNEADEF